MTDGWRQRLKDLVRPVRPIYVRSVEPVEVPVLTESRRRIGRGDFAGAIRYAFPMALRDAERAYGLRFPPELTNGEILTGGFPSDRASVAELFGQLYRIYEPTRYGARPPSDPEAFMDLLRSIYADRPMWSLYVELVVTSKRPAGGAGNPDRRPPTAVG